MPKHPLMTQYPHIYPYPIYRYVKVLRGPRGARGPRGPRGPAGPPGPGLERGAICTGNLILNGTFDNFDSSLPANWDSDSPGNIARNKNPKYIHSGSNSVMFRSQGKQGSINLYQSIDDIMENSCYDLQFWLKSPSRIGNMTVTLTFLDYSENIVQTPIVTEISAASLSSYIFSSFRFITTPATYEAKQAKLEFTVTGKGDIFALDDIIFVCLS